MAIRREYLIELLGARFDVTQAFSRKHALHFAEMAFNFFEELDLLNEEKIFYTDPVDGPEGSQGEVKQSNPS